MAELFICKGEQVHFTNGGCRELYLAWTKCAEKLESKIIAAYLIKQTSLGDGTRADGIDSEYLNDEINSSDLKVRFLGVMDLLIDQVNSEGAIAKEMDIEWNDELRTYWLKQLNKLRTALNVQINL